MHPSVHSSIIYKSQDMEAMKYYSAINKEEWNNAIYSNMDGPGGHYVKRNKSDKDKYCMIPLICGI